MTNTWTLLATVDGVEYWTDADGFDSKYADVFRRPVHAENAELFTVHGEPMGVRWESKRWHYDRFVAPRAEEARRREAAAHAAWKADRAMVADMERDGLL